MADYATLIDRLKRERGLEGSPVIGFGGSYGGMLAAWARLKYPHVWAGAIAGSAPIWTFRDERPPVDPLFFSKGAPPSATLAPLPTLLQQGRAASTSHPASPPSPSCQTSPKLATSLQIPHYVELFAAKTCLSTRSFPKRSSLPPLERGTLV